MRGGIYETRYGYQVRFGKLTKRFKRTEYVLAERFLNGLRFKTDEGTFDLRDYQQDHPLGFANQVQKFLHSKRHLKAVKKYEQRLRFGVNEWGNRNIKEIGFAHMEDLFNKLQDMGKASYYRKQIRDTLRMFFRWLVDRQEIRLDQMPTVPPVRASMQFRKLIDKETQTNILGRIYELCCDDNPRIYIAVLFLASYINMRPSELLNIREQDIDLDMGYIWIKETKTGEPKHISLIDEDRTLLAQEMRKSRTAGFLPGAYFFRHVKGNGAAKPGDKMSRDHILKYWKRAAADLGVEGVPLYPGTKHSSAVALRERHSPEAIRRSTGHKTNVAFERYLQVTGNELRSIYADTRTDNKLITLPANPPADKTLKNKG
jgi:integrase